ncbi:RHS repeat-associated core domain-containing protein [Prevotella sp. P6B1]|uniref:RHS repeat-associated core domain-containing protein n=1 Tax=Prevotella sp. P6B1 TaxID=1410613 RepID=UPI00051C045C|nr:RHS repeat-associated core domain-containing protein [Prevotella sp. P6B1]
MKPYYPFGAPYADNSAATNPDFQPYKYNGKELDKMHGLNTYDHGARQYDPILLRWDRIDPLAEDYRGISPYVYCGNSPVKYIDPDGNKKTQRSKATGIEVEIDYYAPRIRGGGYYHSRSRESLFVEDASELSDLIRKYDHDWSQTSTEQAVLILHSCATSEFAQKISGAQEFQNVIIIAPTENVHTSSNGDERIATTINEKTGEEVEGHWEVYLNGKPLVDESGNPITYPSDSQVGTKGFEYGF